MSVSLIAEEELFMDGSWFCNSKGRWIVMKETDGVEVDLMSVMKTEESQVRIISEDEFCTDEEVANEDTSEDEDTNLLFFNCLIC